MDKAKVAELERQLAAAKSHREELRYRRGRIVDGIREQYNKIQSIEEKLSDEKSQPDPERTVNDLPVGAIISFDVVGLSEGPGFLARHQQHIAIRRSQGWFTTLPGGRRFMSDKGLHEFLVNFLGGPVWVVEQTRYLEEFLDRYQSGVTNGEDRPQDGGMDSVQSYVDATSGIAQPQQARTDHTDYELSGTDLGQPPSRAQRIFYLWLVVENAMAYLQDGKIGQHINAQIALRNRLGLPRRSSVPPAVRINEIDEHLGLAYRRDQWDA